MTAENGAEAEAEVFRYRLLSWFEVHRRDLPWRRTKDPYKIWVSEIMLQQTRVAAVLDHYAHFLERFPTVTDLASASEQDVLAVWSGLGYYRRARMLHRGAQKVVASYGGVLPRTAAELRNLPGIGVYTSAAIASIAFGESVAAVDGNVERVITRVAGLAAEPLVSLAGSRIRLLADTLVDPLRPGNFNEAMMELGATLCLPRKPLCLECPVVELCKTRGEHPVEKPEPMLRRNVAYGLVVRSTNSEATQILLHQRPVEATVMSGMWELPEIAANAFAANQAEFCVRHSIMQTNYFVQIHCVKAERLAEHTLNRHVEQWVTAENLYSLPLTGLTRKVLRRAGLMQLARESRNAIAPQRGCS